jgi:DNA replication protein DnaC
MLTESIKKISGLEKTLLMLQIQRYRSGTPYRIVLMGSPGTGKYFLLF